MIEKQPTTVNMPATVFAEIVSHARTGKPEEICGLVQGAGLIATQVIRALNVAEEKIENYTVDERTLLYFARHEHEMVGIYHSHPVSVAYPSATDAWNAHYPDHIYFICSLEEDDAPVIRAFRMTPYFLDLDIPALRQLLRFYETRPGLFAYKQEAGSTIPPTLAAVATEVAAPFYIVYASEASGEIDSRIVSISEHPLVVI
jgi:proteasome lid subunit RPN8/RPN11